MVFFSLFDADGAYHLFHLIVVDFSLDWLMLLLLLRFEDIIMNSFFVGMQTNLKESVQTHFTHQNIMMY